MTHDQTEDEAIKKILKEYRQSWFEYTGAGLDVTEEYAQKLSAYIESKVVETLENVIWHDSEPSKNVDFNNEPVITVSRIEQRINALKAQEGKK